MAQTINVGLSQGANMMLAHFDNYHNDELMTAGFSPQTSRHISVKRQSPSSNLVNCYPRSVLVDYSNGTGALNKHSFFDTPFEAPSLDVVPTSAPKTDPSSYQRALDGGSKALVLDRHDYWTDFSNAIHHPNTIVSLSSYLLDPVTGLGAHKDFPEQNFSGFDLGMSEYAKVQEVVEDAVRLQFEDCDSVDKINVIVDVDTAWAGFAQRALDDIIDYQLNGHPNRVVYWGLLRELDISAAPRSQYHRILSLLSVEERVGCFVGIAHGPNAWETTAWASLPFFELNERKIDVVQTLTANSEYKYTNCVQVGPRSLSQGFFSKLPQKKKVYPLSSIKFTCSANTQLPTLPNEMAHLKGLPIELAATDALRDDWGAMARFVKSHVRGDARDEQLHQLENLKERYSFGCEGYSSEEE